METFLLDPFYYLDVFRGSRQICRSEAEVQGVQGVYGAVVLVGEDFVGKGRIFGEVRPLLQSHLTPCRTLHLQLRHLLFQIFGLFLRVF